MPNKCTLGQAPAQNKAGIVHFVSMLIPSHLTKRPIDRQINQGKTYLVRFCERCKETAVLFFFPTFFIAGGAGILRTGLSK